VSASEKNVVSVRIGDEEYAIRSPADPDYTRELAAHIDRAIRGVLSQGPMVQAHKAAILASLTITDELFQARAELERLRQEVAERSARLVVEVERRTAGSDLAAGS
jgi:cell division protein ZapA